MIVLSDIKFTIDSFVFFQLLKMCHCYLAFMFQIRNPLSLILILLQNFLSSCFKYFFFVFRVKVLTLMCLGMELFGFIQILGFLSFLLKSLCLYLLLNIGIWQSLILGCFQSFPPTFTFFLGF